MKRVFVYLLGLAFISEGCMSLRVVLPLSSSVKPENNYTIVWNGYGEAYYFKNDGWLRAESYDYRFDVVQERYDRTWKSVKSLHRVHPDYDGRAGSRDQTMYFEIAYSLLNQHEVQSAIQSSLGSGEGKTDTEFRHAVIEIKVNGSSMLPYNRIRITQHYLYEEGLLTETVELYKEQNGKEIPFMKNEEKAWIFIPTKLDKAPTVMGS